MFQKIDSIRYAIVPNTQDTLSPVLIVDAPADHDYLHLRSPYGMVSVSYKELPDLIEILKEINNERK